jgi:hypothetical protein|tara:strand:- start:61 stop:1275 length:1215 start_codon:yes stop_codon:yes gene_type:complete
MADQFYFSRDTKVYMTPSGSTAVMWEIPVLDGFNFSQATNTSEITLNEMADANGKSRRSRQMFTDSYAPAEWSFSTYMRPFGAVPAGSGDVWEPSGSISGNPQHAVEEALWAYFVGATTFTIGTGSTASAWTGPDLDGGSPASPYTPITNNDTNFIVDWTASEVAALGTFDLYFEMGGASSGTNLTYKIEGCVVNSASIDFDIDGIATINWSGMGKIISESGANKPTPTKLIAEGTTTTSNFIRNRLTSLTAATGGSGLFNASYDLVLTGGNITMENNITFLTPETLGVVNQPLGNVTGTRSVSGNFTCYLNNDTGKSAELFEDIIESTTVITNDFDLTFNIGGSNSPKVAVQMPNCHLEVPTHSMDDIISLDVNFHALPASIDPGSSAANYEVKVTYTGNDLA